MKLNEEEQLGVRFPKRFYGIYQTGAIETLIPSGHSGGGDFYDLKIESAKIWGADNAI